MAQATAATRTSVVARAGDLWALVGVVAIIMMLVLPVPPLLIDLLLAVNIAVSLTMLLVALNVQRPTDFSTFPSLLLVVTLFRLSLNIASTRQILLNGYAGKIIYAFGNFVVGGNYVVGFVVFLILVVIQFVVITRGAERVAEVAARFTLDAMPGKQMAIDADLNAGTITEAEARQRRKEIQREADFYGAMDGAAKFVKGDAIAAIVIVVINTLGGFLIGMWQKGLPLVEALQRYTLLSVGDGLVAQVPALMISVGTGIVVTRAASAENLGKDVARELLSQPGTLAAGAAILGLFALVPGFPPVPFLLLAGLLGYLAYALQQELRRAAAAAQEEERTAELEAAKKPENVLALLNVDPIELEIGYGLIPLVDPAQGGDLFDRVTLIRRQMALDLGLVIPAIRVRDNMQLKPGGYVIKVKGVEVGRGELSVDHFLAMDPGTVSAPVEGTPTTEPAFGLPALWISANRREQAEMAGYTVVDPPSVLATHLTEIIRAHAHTLLGRQEVKTLIDGVKENYPAVVEELVPDLLTMGEVQKVLQNLLREGVSIRNLVTILETLADFARVTKEVDTLTEYVRQALGRQICAGLAGSDGRLWVVTLDPVVEDTLARGIQRTEQGVYLSLEPGWAQKVLNRVAAELEKLAAGGHNPVILCGAEVRPHVRRLVERVSPKVNVLSYNEVPSGAEIEAVGTVTLANEG
ncbi:MAG TPA: flagellar biosynthesis protein FlhA [Firmicutes bacterium]|nr:flagellar biosynthesis protein FlhA [Bacillota bacterium]